MRKFIIRDMSNVYWPGLLDYSGKYDTYEAALARANEVDADYASKHGRCDGPSLRVVEISDN